MSDTNSGGSSYGDHGPQFGRFRVVGLTLKAAESPHFGQGLSIFSQNLQYI